MIPRDPYTPWKLWAVMALAFIALAGACQNAQAEPRLIVRSETEDLTIILFDEPCALAAVTNLRFRATWQKGRQIIEGCWIPSPYGVVMFYFADRTVGVVPVQLFVKIVGA